jgi:cytochrome c-type biogenesis protein CcmH
MTARGGRLLLRYGLVLAVGAALAVAALATSHGPASTSARVEAIATELRCPVCQGLSVADSPSSTAQEIRRQIEQLLGDGLSADEIKEHFAARYGDWILLSPRPQLAWLVPPLALAAGVAGGGLWLLRRSRVPAAPSPEARVPLTALRERVRQEVRELDA